ncbi:MAG TPA: hypothetical protein ENO05_04695, partial [Bacteroides sp.]|nr:hypothetical protein [Bacteroides sp.]
KWWFLIGFAVIPLFAHGQSVGLVLSGGGAKGIAHIGVIRALEENRIPIDYVGGTSMGAIVGGLYAIGMSTDEMIRIFKSDQFQSWLSGRIDPRYRYYFKEEYPGPDILSIGLNLKDSVTRTQLPMSLVPNHLMDFAFMEIFSRASAAANYNFDSLFVPFLCISADISNNREVVHRRGSLTQAIRASMTIPLYFRPILIDGNIMYDGGIYDNFPLEQVENQFRPDVIIGSKTAERNEPPDEFDIMGQIENIVMKPAEYHIEKGKGILLDMKFKNASLLDFGRIDEYVELGYRTAMEKMDSIRQLVGEQADDSVTLAEKRRSFRERWPELRFRDVEVSGLTEAQQSYVENSIRKHDSVITLDQLRREYLKLAHDQSLVYLYPLAVYQQEDNLFRLGLRVIPRAPLEAKFGLFFSTTGLSQTYLGFSYRQISEVSTHLKGSIQFGRLYDGVNVGIRFDYPWKVPIYFDGSFNYNRFNYNTSSPHLFFEDLKPSYIIENEFNFRFDVGIPREVNGVFKGGLGIGNNREIYYMSRDFTTEDTSDVSNVSLMSLYVASETNTLNNKQYATEGKKSSISLRAGYGIEAYSPGSTSGRITDERLNYFWFAATVEKTDHLKMSRRFSLGYYYAMQATFKPLQVNYLSSIIEAPVFRPNVITKSMFMKEYRAHQFIAAGIMPLYNISQQIHAKAEAYAFFPLQEILSDENNNAYLGSYFNRMKTIFNASLNIVSPAGPLGFHIGYITEEEKPWVFQLSFGYLLFNKRSTEE